MPFSIAGGIQAIAFLMTISCSVGAILTLGIAHRLLRLAVGDSLIPLAVPFASAASVAVTLDFYAKYIPDMSVLLKMIIEILAFLILYSSAVFGMSRKMREIALRVMSQEGSRM